MSIGRAPPRSLHAAALAVALVALVAGGAGFATAQTPAAPPPAKGAKDAKDAKDAKEPTGRVGEHLPAFTAKVTRNEKESDFDSAKQAKITVYCFAGPTCPATPLYAPRLAALAEAYGAKGVDFVFIYPRVKESAAEKRRFHKEKRLGGAFLDDAQGAIAKRLGGARTGEALICDKDGKVVYRGGIDDNLNEPSKVKVKYVAQALDELLAGKPVSVTTGKVFG